MSKICIFFESYIVGGFDVFTYHLINNWNPEDQITLLCNKSHSGACYFKDKIYNPQCTIELYDMTMVNDWDNLVTNKCISRMLHILSFFVHITYYIFFSYNRLRLNRFDYLLVLNGGYPGCAGSRGVGISWWLYTKKKSIHNFHNLAIKSIKLHFLVDTIIDKLLIRATSYFVSVSKAAAESIRIRSSFKNLDNITYIYNGIPEAVVIPTFNLKKHLGLPTKTKILMMLATYEERKGHTFIIDVLTEIVKHRDDVHLIFCGYGKPNEIERVQNYAKAKQLSANVHCFGYVSNAMEYLAQADLIMIGSQSFESFGLTSIEAMKYHKVVLSTNVGGLREVIQEDVGGYLFAPTDYLSMANKVLELLSDPLLMKKQQCLGYYRYKQFFTAKKVSDNYRQLLIHGDKYEECI